MKIMKLFYVIVYYNAADVLFFLYVHYLWPYGMAVLTLGMNAFLRCDLLGQGESFL